MININNTYYSSETGIKLFVTESQAKFIDKCIEGYRIVYNWSLNKEFEQYELFKNGKTDRQFLSFIDIQNLYPEFRKTNELLSELPTHSMINAIKDMIKGYESFFRNKNVFNKPTFKENKNTAYSSYRPRSEISSFYFVDNMLKIEGLSYKEMIETSFHTGNYFPKDKIKYINPIIYRNNWTGKYSLNYIIEKQKLDSYFIINNIPKSEPIGVDVNKNIVYACSNGLNIYSTNVDRIIKHISDLNKKIKSDDERYKNELSINPNAVKSNNALFRLEKKRKLYQKISNIHKDICYKGALDIIKLNPEAVIIENLNIKKIMSFHYIADDLQYHPLGISQQILESQCFKYNIPVVYAPLYFQSSNYCSNCGAYKDIKCYQYFICPSCGARIQRDTNAAINLKNWYLNNKANIKI